MTQGRSSDGPTLRLVASACPAPFVMSILPASSQRRHSPIYSCMRARELSLSGMTRPSAYTGMCLRSSTTAYLWSKRLNNLEIRQQLREQGSDAKASLVNAIAGELWGPVDWEGRIIMELREAIGNLPNRMPSLALGMAVEIVEMYLPKDWLINLDGYRPNWNAKLLKHLGGKEVVYCEGDHAHPGVALIIALLEAAMMERNTRG